MSGPTSMLYLTTSSTPEMVYTMSKDILPSTPDTLPIYIAEKLDALGRDPKEVDLNMIRVLLYTNREERVVSHEEVQVLKNLEKKVLENQNNYKKETKHMNDRANFSTRFFLLFPMLAALAVFIIGSILKREALLKYIILLGFWPIKLAAVVILYYSYFPDGGFLDLIGIPYYVKPQVFENEEDDDWEDSMTSTELLSRQMAIVTEWEKLREERKEYFSNNSLSVSALICNSFYTVIRFGFIMELEKQKSIPFFDPSFFLVTEFIFSFSLLFLFFLQFLSEVGHGEDFKKQSV
ncbi:hypothetical protein CAEBREN_08267 [Caenorhabditis brenneri]|uniref:Uncharacterized protein n=1 Tax=Caenorhabditis brenneri TaxID=135651 RepID=G0MBW7_CAEBE|nr:hypothetical protein CAEBREN_08267 [Caenorhabditis brenneri]